MNKSPGHDNTENNRGELMVDERTAEGEEHEVDVSYSCLEDLSLSLCFECSPYKLPGTLYNTCYKKYIKRPCLEMLMIVTLFVS